MDRKDIKIFILIFTVINIGCTKHLHYYWLMILVLICIGLICFTYSSLQVSHDY